jgi:hypothetical protein
MRPHPYADVVLADKPFAYWRLNERTGFGTTAYDISGNNNHAIYSAEVIREQDSAVENGDSSIKTVNNSAVSFVKDLTGLTGPFSYEFWINPTVIPIPMPQEYAVALCFTNIESNFSIHLTKVRASFELHLVVAPDAEGYFTTGKWAHIICVWDDNSYINLYKDGIRLINAGPYVGPMSLGTGRHYIGRWSGGLTYPWDGGIDEVSLYDYALTESQVKSHYLRGNFTSLFKRAKKIGGI